MSNMQDRQAGPDCGLKGTRSKYRFTIRVCSSAAT